MRTKRMITLLFLVVSLAACNRGPSAGDRAKALMQAGNDLLAQSGKASHEWTNEFSKAFRPQSREQFPANRDQLRVSADKITKALDDDTRLNESAIEKYEQALALIKDGPQRQGMVLVVSAIKKEKQINELHKTQMKLVSDEKIVDAKTLNARFMEIMDQVMVVKRQSDAEFSEGRRLMGM